MEWNGMRAGGPLKVLASVLGTSLWLFITFFKRNKITIGFA